MTKPVKQRFYVDLDYDTKAIPKRTLQKIIKDAVQAELPDLARDFQTKLGGVNVGSEPVQVRVQRQATKNANQRNKQWYNTY
jgi:hypothetical protein